MLKQLLRSFVAIACRPLPYRWLQNLANRKLVVVNYHSIHKSDADPIINQNPYRTAEAFEQDLIFFKKHYQMVDLTTIINHYRNQTPMPKKSLAITFDDGLAVVYHTIRPILLKHGVSATFFINPAFIDQAGLHYKRKINIVCRHLQSHPQYLSQIQQILQEAGIQKTKTIEAVRQLGYHQQHLIDRIASTMNLNFDQYLEENPIYLTSEQIKTMIGEGFSFGAHSWDHPNYRHLTLEEQTTQTLRSMQWVAQNFNLNYKVFAFPYRDFHLKKDLFRNIAPDVDLTFGTHGMVDDVVPYHIQRTDVERSGLECQSAMKINYMKYITQALIGKQQLKRQEN